MAKKKKSHEEHVDESWLIPYADILTLLLALFIVLFATSQVDQKKFEQMAKSLNAAFHGSTSIMSGTDNPRQVRESITEPEKKMMAAISENSNLKKVKSQIDQKIKEEGMEDQVKTSLNAEGLKIILTDEVLFKSGEAIIKKENQGLLDIIQVLIGELLNPVRVNGYTDNVPISTAKYPSNWELSSARGVAVLKFLIEDSDEMDLGRFSSSGFGEHQPIASNEDEEGRAKNRRVEIVIERIYGEGLLKPEEEGGALNE